jgi:hypothetical protein
MSDATGQRRTYASHLFRPRAARNASPPLNGQADASEASNWIDRHANVCVPQAGFDTNIVKLTARRRLLDDVRQAMVTTIMNRAAGDRPTHSFDSPRRTTTIYASSALSDEQRQLYGSWRTHLMGKRCRPSDRSVTTAPHGCGRSILARQFQGRARNQKEYQWAKTGPLALRSIRRSYRGAIN